MAPEMPAHNIITGHIRHGVWTVILDIPGNTLPDLEVIHDGKPLPGMTISIADPVKGGWRLSVPIPAETLGDGMQIYLVRDLVSGRVIGQIPILSGDVLTGSLSAEVELLRAELEVLKRAVLRLAAP